MILKKCIKASADNLPSLLRSISDYIFKEIVLIYLTEVTSKGHPASVSDSPFYVREMMLKERRIHDARARFVRLDA